MARYSKGILGPVSGTVGTVVGSSWKGIKYLKSQPDEKRSSSTVDQIDAQLRFSAVVNFVNTMVALLQLTFKKYAIKMSEVNAAFSYNYNNAITGVSPDYEIDFSKALVSRGDLPNATAPHATVTNHVVHFTWTDNSGAGTAQPTDKAVLVAFCKNFNQTIFTAGSSTRSSGAGTLDCTIFSGFPVETWIAFLSDDDTEASNSFFTGELTP